jgi:methionine-rich copper-binding protein CopC
MNGFFLKERGSAFCLLISGVKRAGNALRSNIWLHQQQRRSVPFSRHNACALVVKCDTSAMSESSEYEAAVQRASNIQGNPRPMSHPMTWSAKVQVLLTLLLALDASSAWAHAKLVRSDPLVHTVLRRPPMEVRLWFSLRLESAFSTAELLDHSGKRINEQLARVSPADARLLSFKVPRLPSGEYTVRYRVLSLDGHVVESEFRFAVKTGAELR